MDTQHTTPAPNSRWVNRKTAGHYRVLSVALDATNARNGTSVVVYRQDGAGDRQCFVRDRDEFFAKFDPLPADEDTARDVDLPALRAAATEACAVATANRLSIFGAVNWSDLRCTEASRVESDQGTVSYCVLISEASPDARALQQAIASELLRRGFPDIDVVTEW